MWWTSLLFAAAVIAAPHAKRWAGDGVSSDLPSTYADITFCQTEAQIDTYSYNSYETLLNQLDNATGWFNGSGYWVSQNGWTAYAGWDFLHGTRDFYTVLSNAQKQLETSAMDGNALWGVPLVDFYNDDSGWAALANVRAYEAYGDSIFLQRAKGVWQFITDHGYIFPKDLSAGYLVGTKYPNNTLLASCNGSTNLGGVYWENGVPNVTVNAAAAADPNINSVSTGLYALLGAELCRLTSNQTYCEMAYSSIQWIDRFMMTPDDLVYDHLNGSSCMLNTGLYSYNTGLYIATYAELGNITCNATAIELAQRTALASMTKASWDTPDGVIKEAEGDPTQAGDGVGFKAILIRYLQRAYPWLNDESLKAAIVDFVNIQYWSLTQFDSNSPSQPLEYGRNWTGPAFSTWLSHTEIAALDVLNALSLNPPSAFPSSSNSSSPVATNSTCS